MKNKIYLIIIGVLILGLFALTTMLLYSNKKANTPYIDTITLFGTEIKVLPNVYTYRINAKSNELKAVSKGCETPYSYEVSKFYKRIDKKAQMSGISYYPEGTDRAYFFLDFIKYDEKEGKAEKIYATYYFEVFFDKPLIIAKGCSAENKK